MPSKKPGSVELNEPGRRPERPSEFRQHLVNASNELYLHELMCLRAGWPCPGALKRAHASIRAEIRRLEAEEAGTPDAEPQGLPG